MRKKQTTGLSTPTLDRMPYYLTQLYKLKEAGEIYVSSSKLGEFLGIKDAQIRKDLSSVGAYGRSWYGYNVQETIEAIETILGLKRNYTIIIIGIGNLGRALANYYSKIENSAFKLKGLFDAQPEIVGNQLGEFIIQPIDNLENFVSKNKIDIAILTVPDEASEQLAMRLTTAGIKGIYNFSMTELKIPNNIALENARLSYGLYKLAYGITQRNSL